MKGKSKSSFTSQERALMLGIIRAMMRCQVRGEMGTETWKIGSPWREAWYKLLFKFNEVNRERVDPVGVVVQMDTSRKGGSE